MNEQRCTKVRTGRRGFTFVEILIAAMITAMTLGAAATMVNAISNAALETKETRNEKKAGRILVDRVSERIRNARGIGEVRPDAIVLWEKDTNSDDRVNLHETSVITYSTSTKELTRTITSGSSAADVGPEVPTATFTNVDSLNALAGGYTKQEAVIGERVESFSMSGYPSKTETRVVNFSFEKAGRTVSHAFRESVAPRATADYLFNDATKEVPAAAGMPVRRIEYSRWTGWADVDGETIVYPDGSTDSSVNESDEED
jgi:type II secretory pathway pseudopilin PulG